MDHLLRLTEPETLALAPVIGAYLFVSSIGFLRTSSAVPDFAAELQGRPALAHALGAVAFLTGAGVVSFHRHWSTPPEVVVSLTGCWWAFEGAGLLAFPAAATAALQSARAHSVVRASNGTALLVGVYLMAATTLSAVA